MSSSAVRRRDQHQVDVGGVDPRPLQRDRGSVVACVVEALVRERRRDAARIPVRRSIQSGASPSRASISDDSTIPGGRLVPTEATAAPPSPRGA